MARGRILGDGAGFGRAVDGCRGAEDQLLYACALHGAQQCEGRAQIVFVVFKRLADRLANCLKTCKMHHGIDLMLAENAVKRRLVSNICLVYGGHFSYNFCNALDRTGRAVRKVIHHDNVVTCLVHFYYRMRANVARTAR